MQVSRDDILRYRVRTQQLDGTASGADAAVLDVGVQDSGPDGAGLALELRGPGRRPRSCCSPGH